MTVYADVVGKEVTGQTARLTTLISSRTVTGIWMARAKEKLHESSE